MPLDRARQRDIQRLHAVWDGHHILWTMPEWNGPDTWSEEHLKVSCISGEELERFHIVHIGSGGGVFEPTEQIIGGLEVEGFLDAWLDAEVDLAQTSADTLLEITVPIVVEGGVSYHREAFTTVPGGRHSFGRMMKKGGSLSHSGHRVSTTPRPISPESETLTREPNETDGTLVLRLQWKEPLDQIMPAVSSEDDLFARDQMRLIRDQARGDVEQARRSAGIAARNWVIDGHSTVNSTWLRPIVATEGELAAVIAIQSRFDVEHESLADVYADERLQQELRKPMGVRRALGIPGLAWALMLDRLSKGKSEQLCELCGSPITARANKKYCGEHENPGCYRARKRRDGGGAPGEISRATFFVRDNRRPNVRAKRVWGYVFNAGCTPVQLSANGHSPRLRCRRSSTWVAAIRSCETISAPAEAEVLRSFMGALRRRGKVLRVTR